MKTLNLFQPTTNQEDAEHNTFPVLLTNQSVYMKHTSASIQAAHLTTVPHNLETHWLTKWRRKKGRDGMKSSRPSWLTIAVKRGRRIESCLMNLPHPILHVKSVQTKFCTPAPSQWQRHHAIQTEATEGDYSMVYHFSEEEYRKGVAILTNNKASGRYAVLVEQLNNIGTNAHIWLLTMLNKCFMVRSQHHENNPKLSPYWNMGRTAISTSYRLQTTQPTSGGAVTSNSSCCANCVEPPPPPAMGARFTVFLACRPCGPWMADTVAHKRGWSRDQSRSDNSKQESLDLWYLP